MKRSSFLSPTFLYLSRIFRIHFFFIFVSLIRRFMIHNQICDKDVYNGDVDKKLMEYFSFSYLLNFVVNCERGCIKGWKEGKSNELTLKFTIFEISNREKKIYRNIFLINSLLVRERNREIFLSSLLWQQVKTSVVKNVCYGINHKWYNRKIWTNSRDHYQLYGSIKKNCCNFSEIGKNKKKNSTNFLFTPRISRFIFFFFFIFKSRIKIEDSYDFWLRKSIALQHPRAL